MPFERTLDHTHSLQTVKYRHTTLVLSSHVSLNHVRCVQDQQAALNTEQKISLLLWKTRVKNQVEPEHSSANTSLFLQVLYQTLIVFTTYTQTISRHCHPLYVIVNCCNLFFIRKSICQLTFAEPRTPGVQPDLQRRPSFRLAGLILCVPH